jgi:hypothetical protein
VLVPPTIATVASAGGALGTVLTDQATLSGGLAPTGTITFVAYGPNDATCTTVAFTSNAIPVNGNGTYTSAPGFTPTLPGTYRWRAFYSGDANNAAVSGACGAANESADIIAPVIPPPPPAVVVPPTPVEPIPTLSFYALIALMLLIGLGTPYYLRRAKR